MFCSMKDVLETKKKAYRGGRDRAETLLCRVGIAAKNRANLKNGSGHIAIDLHIASVWMSRCLATLSYTVSKMERISIIEKK